MLRILGRSLPHSRRTWSSSNHQQQRLSVRPLAATASAIPLQVHIDPPSNTFSHISLPQHQFCPRYARLANIQDPRQRYANHAIVDETDDLGRQGMYTTPSHSSRLTRTHFSYSSASTAQQRSYFNPEGQDFAMSSVQVT